MTDDILPTMQTAARSAFEAANPSFQRVHDWANALRKTLIDVGFCKTLNAQNLMQGLPFIRGSNDQTTSLEIITLLSPATALEKYKIYSAATCLIIIEHTEQGTDISVETNRNSRLEMSLEDPLVKNHGFDLQSANDGKRHTFSWSEREKALEHISRWITNHALMPAAALYPDRPAEAITLPTVELQ